MIFLFLLSFCHYLYLFPLELGSLHLILECLFVHTQIFLVFDLVNSSSTATSYEYLYQAMPRPPLAMDSTNISISSHSS